MADGGSLLDHREQRVELHALEGSECLEWKKTLKMTKKKKTKSVTTFFRFFFFFLLVPLVVEEGSFLESAHVACVASASVVVAV